MFTSLLTTASKSSGPNSVMASRAILQRRSAANMRLWMNAQHAPAYRHYSSNNQNQSENQVEEAIRTNNNWLPHVLMSKPPKGFEKFFKKKDQRNKESKPEASGSDKEAKKNDQEESSAKKEESGKESEEQKNEEQEDASKDQDKKSHYDDFQEQVGKFLFDGNKNPKPDRWLALFATACMLYYITTYQKPVPELVYMDFLNNYLLKNQIKEIKISKDRRSEVFNHRADIEMIDGSKYYMILGSQESFLAKLDMVQRQMGKQPHQFIPVKYVNNNEESMSAFYFNLFVGMIAVAAMYQIFKARNNIGNKAAKGKSASKKDGGGWFGGNQFMGGMQKSKANVFGEDNKIDVRFKDVAGNEGAKQEVTEFVDFLKNPKKYQKLGARIPRGALLTGPPGTGKTLLAKAVAGEAGVPFLSTSGSEFVEMFVGVGASRVRDLFKTAREKSPAIVFIDEIDAVGKKRQNRMGGGNEERDNTLNQLLVEMDGFGTDSSVIVLAATNRSDILDNALLRPGRFDRQVEVILPTIKERQQIFEVHLTNIKVDETIEKSEYARKLAALTPGFSGADIMNICNEGAIIAARANKEAVSIKDFEMATERVIGGIEKKMPMNSTEKRTVAYHEAGHAVAGWFSESAAPLIKLTIIPRAKGSLGFAQYLPDELTLYTKEQLHDMIKVALGGRIAEEIFFKRITTGASDDLKKCTQIAKGLVTEYGMSPALGTINYSTENGYQKNYSEKTAKLIDQEVSSVIQNRYKECNELLHEKKDIIEKLAEELLAKETLSLPEIVEVLGPRPFPLKDTVKEYLLELQDRNEAEEQEAKVAKDKENSENVDAAEVDLTQEATKEDSSANSESDQASENKEENNDDDKTKK